MSRQADLCDLFDQGLALLDELCQGLFRSLDPSFNVILEFRELVVYEADVGEVEVGPGSSAVAASVAEARDERNDTLVEFAEKRS